MNQLIFAAAFILVVLLVIAFYYQFLLYRKHKQQNVLQYEREQKASSRRVHNADSIVLLARAVLDNQVSMTEASIRINALKPTLDLSPDVEQDLVVFSQLAEATAHIPILDKWRGLSRKEQVAFDMERAQIETKFETFVLAAAKKITENKLRSRSDS